MLLSILLDNIYDIVVRPRIGGFQKKTNMYKKIENII